MDNMNYWEESIKEAISEIGITATKEQVDQLVEWVEGCHENYGLATGNDVASANFESEESKELKRIKAEADKARQWELSTRPCEACLTTGRVKDGWGRDVGCDHCRGKGRL